MPTVPDTNYPQTPDEGVVLNEQAIEQAFIEKLRNLKYTVRPDITDREGLERNFRQKFEALNRVKLTDAEFQRLLDELTIPDVFTAARVLREKNDFILNISRYISTATAEPEIDLAQTHKKLVELQKTISAARDKHNKFLKELGLPPLP